MGVTPSSVGPCPHEKSSPSRSVVFNGTTGYASDGTSQDNPQVLSVEIWFMTSAQQGKLIGFGSASTGSSGSYDRHLYVDSNGQLRFGCTPTR